MKFLGYGGVGDCFIIILKLLQQKEDFTYTHAESTVEKLDMCRELLEIYGIQYNLVHAPNLQQWWGRNHSAYDKCFNLCAAGYINAPPRDFHWEPCRDEGVSDPFNSGPTTEMDIDARMMSEMTTIAPFHSIPPRLGPTRPEPDPDS